IVDGASKDWPAERVCPDDSRRQQPAQVAVVHLELRRRAVRRAVHVGAHPELLGRGIEKGAVAAVVHAWNQDRAAEAAAIIRLSIAGLGTAGGVVEKRVRVQRFVPERAEAGPMRLVLT